MTPLNSNERERQRLISVASEYERQGYEVKLQPSRTDLPAFLAGFEPDLIATGKGETVVVQVKKRTELKTRNPLLRWRMRCEIDPDGVSNSLSNHQIMTIQKLWVQAKFALRWMRRMSFSSMVIYPPLYSYCGLLPKVL